MQSKKTSGNDLAAFQIIIDFVSNLEDHFGRIKSEPVHALKLYNRLITKLSFKDDELIVRHLQAFKAFSIANREAVQTQDKEKIHSNVTFSSKIYINVKYFLLKSDAETQQIIWEYILSISALLDPETDGKELLKNLKSTASATSSGGGNPLDLLGMMGGMMGGMMEGEGANAEGNPMAMMSGLLQSGVMGNMIQNVTEKIENGSIDFNKILEGIAPVVDMVKNELEKEDNPLFQNLLKGLNNNNNNNNVD